METVEQFSQTGTAFSDKSASVTALINRASTLAGIRPQTETLIQTDTSISELELPLKTAVPLASGPAEHLHPAHLSSDQISSDQISQTDRGITSHQSYGLSLSGQSADSAQPANPNTKTAAIDPLTGIFEGAALTLVIDKTVASAGDLFTKLARNQETDGKDINSKDINGAEFKTLAAEDGNAPIADEKAIAVRQAAPAFPGRLLKYTPGAVKYDEAAKQWQQRMKDRGWKIAVDGFYGAQSKAVCIAFQKEKGLPADGIVGPNTWNQAFNNFVPINPPGGSGTSDINQRGLELIKKFEGLSLRAYRDPVGIWTIGYGHTGPEVGRGDVITRTEAERLLRSDLDRFESSVQRLVKVPLNSNQFSALVSFTYNVGAGNLGKSTLLKLLNRRNYQGAADQFPKWVYGGGKVLSGLVRRRREERALFLS